MAGKTAEIICATETVELRSVPDHPIFVYFLRPISESFPVCSVTITRDQNHIV